MQKALVFLLAVVVLLAIVWTKPVEGFTTLMGVNWNEMNDGTPAALYTKLPINEPKVVSLTEQGVGNIQPSPPPASDLPTAPFQQRAKENPNPYRDPSNEPAKYIRLLGVKENLQAFFGFQAGQLETSSDPAIQIPLTRARADMGELIDVQSVMERNPGLPSRINNKQLDDIQSNLRYLRAILNDLVSSGAIQPTAPIDGQPDAAEGFVDSSATEGPRATLKQLQEFQVKVVVEIQRLSASGTSDPVIQGRMNTLNRIKDDLDDTISKLQSGALTPETVPIFASDIEKALPVLGKPSSPLPQILQKAQLPPAIASLFPGGLAPKDLEQAKQINNVVKGYMKNLFEGASWGVNLNFQYENPTLQKLKTIASLANAQGASSIETGLPGVQGAGKLEGAEVKQQTPSMAIAGQLPTDSSYDSGLPGASLNRILPTPKAGSLDWKQRSQEIREQIRRRGLDPMQFGAMPEHAQVGPDYSWRGYAYMMCTRLNTTTDPGLAQSCGCPPLNWQGWKE